jgi:hypothetical protein
MGMADLSIEVDQSLGGHRAVKVLTRLKKGRGLFRTVRVDDGPEFTPISCQGGGQTKSS